MEDYIKEERISKYKIIRKTSQYNKYIKWFVETYYEDGKLLSSFGYRTEREARQSVRPKVVMPIGNRLITTFYEEIKD